MLIGILPSAAGLSRPCAIINSSIADESRISVESFHVVAKDRPSGYMSPSVLRLSSRTKHAQIHSYGIRWLPSRLPSSLSDSSLEGPLALPSEPEISPVQTCAEPESPVRLIPKDLLWHAISKRGTGGSDHVQGKWKPGFELFDSHYHFPPCNCLSLTFAVR
jgi:hypothetical protein